MATATKILDEHGDPMRAARVVPQAKQLRAGFDAAQWTDDNRNHWANADALSPNRASDSGIRNILRNRARYEMKNNSYLCGMIRTKANYAIGRGPRLQMLTADKESNKRIEHSWKRWCRLTNFCGKLRIMSVGKYTDGESFALKVTNRSLLGKHNVTLDLRLYEPEQIADPYWRAAINDNRRIDGVMLDDHGDPESYHVLHVHPGDGLSGILVNGSHGQWVPARQMLHLYREDRATQRRGIPYITPALPLFAIMRRYTLAALHSSEWAAELNAVMKTSASITASEADEMEDQLMTIPWMRNMMMSLPFGWELQQIKSEQPATGYAEFYRQVLNEAARCLELPFNVAAANSSEYNYASGRLDHQLFFKDTEIERTQTEDMIVEDVFEDWLREDLSQASGIAIHDIDMSLYPHRWGWDDVEHVDPQKVAAADLAYWDKGLLTDDQWLLRRNIDPEEHFDQLREQVGRRTELGLPLPGVAMQSISTDTGGDGANQPEDQTADGMDR